MDGADGATSRRLEHHLRPTPTSPSSRRGLADISNFVVAQHREGAVLGYRYPAQFDDHIFEGADGERIAASIGAPGGGPARR